MWVVVNFHRFIYCLLFTIGLIFPKEILVEQGI
jgi:hypothetical protein